MRVALIQQSVSEDADGNVRVALQRLEEAKAGGADLAVYAELAFTRFFPARRGDPRAATIAESIPGPELPSAMTAMVTLFSAESRSWPMQKEESSHARAR